MNPRTFLAASILASTPIAGCAVNDPTAGVANDPTGQSATFAWFEYEGRDEVFEKHRPGPDEYQNPILAGYYPDPSITRAGDDYYLVHSTFCHFPGIPVFHSRDLVNWTQIGSVIDRPGMLDFDGLGLSRGVFAPTIEHHDGLFYVANTCVDCGGNFVVTATDPAGPWSDPAWLDEVGGIDPSLFFDDNGEAWIMNNEDPIGEPLYEGHRAIWIQRFDPETLTTFGERTMIINGGVDLSQKPIWIEGPHIYKVNGSYYLTCAEGGTSVQHSQVVFKADHPQGPWVPWEGNPILTQRHLDPDRDNPVTSAGHADLVQTPSGEWWATFLATRPYRGNHYNTGRETFLLPVSWESGWPVILEGDAEIPYVEHKPDLPARPAAEVPTTGNFVFRDTFEGDNLRRYWQFVRVPSERWHQLGSDGLTIRARGEHIGERLQPSFIGRRQQHMSATFSTEMSYTPERPGERAGLIAMQSDEHYFFFGLAAQEGGTVVRLDRRAGIDDPADGRSIASQPINLDGPVRLRIEADDDRYTFSYATATGDWNVLAEDVDGSILSTQTAGGFVGALVGPYAYRAPE